MPKNGEFMFLLNIPNFHNKEANLNENCSKKCDTLFITR